MRWLPRRPPEGQCTPSVRLNANARTASIQSSSTTVRLRCCDTSHVCITAAEFKKLILCFLLFPFVWMPPPLPSLHSIVYLSMPLPSSFCPIHCSSIFSPSFLFPALLHTPSFLPISLHLSSIQSSPPFHQITATVTNTQLVPISDPSRGSHIDVMFTEQGCYSRTLVARTIRHLSYDRCRSYDTTYSRKRS